MGHEILHVAFNMFNKHNILFNYLFEQITQNVQQKAQFSIKSETKVKDKVIIF